jgi:hypothetical protein
MLVYWDTEILPRSEEAQICEMLFFVLPQGYKSPWSNTPKTEGDTNMRMASRAPGQFMLQQVEVLVPWGPDSMLLNTGHLEMYHNNRQLFRKPLRQFSSGPFDVTPRLIQAGEKFYCRATWSTKMRPQVLVDTQIRVRLFGT